MLRDLLENLSRDLRVRLSDSSEMPLAGCAETPLKGFYLIMYIMLCECARRTQIVYKHKTSSVSAFIITNPRNSLLWVGPRVLAPMVEVGRRLQRSAGPPCLLRPLELADQIGGSFEHLSQVGSNSLLLLLLLHLGLTDFDLDAWGRQGQRLFLTELFKLLLELGLAFFVLLIFFVLFFVLVINHKVLSHLLEPLDIGRHVQVLLDGLLQR